jgi:hypothetical protein
MQFNIKNFYIISYVLINSYKNNGTLQYTIRTSISYAYLLFIY